MTTWTSLISPRQNNRELFKDWKMSTVNKTALNPREMRNLPAVQASCRRQLVVRSTLQPFYTVCGLCGLGASRAFFVAATLIKPSCSRGAWGPFKKYLDLTFMLKLTRTQLMKPASCKKEWSGWAKDKLKLLFESIWFLSIRLRLCSENGRTPFGEPICIYVYINIWVNICTSSECIFTYIVNICILFLGISSAYVCMRFALKVFLILSWYYCSVTFVTIWLYHRT